MQKVASSGKLTTNGGSAQVLAVRFLAKTAFLGISVAFLVLVPMPAICTEAFYGERACMICSPLALAQ